MPTSSPSLDQLPEHSLTLLHCLATAFPGRSKTALIKQMNALRCRDEEGRPLAATFPALLESLQQQGWVRQEQHPAGRLFCMPPSQRNPVLLDLLQRSDSRQRLRAQLASVPMTANIWLPQGQTELLQKAWLHLLNDELDEALGVFEVLERVCQMAAIAPRHPLRALLADDTGLQILAGLSDAVRQFLLDDYLELANLFLVPAGTAYDLGLQQFEATPSPELNLQLLLQALWRGDWTNLERFGQRGLMYPVLEPLLRGNPQQALLPLRAWLADMRKQTGKRRIDMPPVLNAFYCLALIGEGDPKQRAQLKQALTLGVKERYGSAYAPLLQLLEQQQGSRIQSSRLVLPDRLTGFDGLMLALALYWLDAPEAHPLVWRNRLLDLRNQLESEGYGWLAAETDALLAKQFGIPRQFAERHQSAGLQPLVELHQRQEAWQHALHALSQLKPGSKAKSTTKSEKKTRLVWLISHSDYSGYRVEPREQKLGAKGQWSKGQAVALKRLVAESDSLGFLNEQDREAIRVIQTSQPYYGDLRYELPAVLALPKLAGHPALYWSDAPDVRIDLLAGQPSLRLEVKGKQIQLQLEPKDIGSHGELLLEKETPTRLRVYSINRELRQISEIVGDGLSVPLAAKAQLVEAIGAIAPLLPIHSDIPELAGHMETVLGDATLYAHLLPLEAGLRLQLLVRPLAEGSWLRPGQGAENLLGERDGQPLQVQRDLTAERQALQQVLHGCPGLARADSDGQEWQLEQPEDALQVLYELQALDGELLQCVWPEGERMRIKARPTLQNLKLGLKQQGDWFVLQGEIKLDDGRVLQLRQLLELLKASPGRFLKLDERDWLALGDSLRKRLEELSHLAERANDQGLRLSTLSAPTIAALADEAGEFKADSQWQAHLDKLESLRHYQPQLPRSLQAELRDYQQEGFAWLARLAHWGVGACLADDMGLGKTVQTLALLLERAAAGPQLVVAPTSVTLNWQAECVRFAPSLNLRLYQQQRSLEDLGPGDLVITSYGLLQQDAAAFAAQHWTSVVLDEAQAIKNAQTKRSQAAMGLQADLRLIATGTPLENHLGELWNLFRFINPGLLGSQDSFNARFANPIEQGNAGARRALKALIQPFILRRLKSQVLEELPARTEIIYKVPLSDEELHQYEALRQQAVDNIAQLAPDEGKPLQVLAEITRLRRFCCHPSLVLPGTALPGSKLLAFQEIVEELLEGGHKALVFSQFVDHLSIVRGWLDQQGIAYQYLDGATPTKQRQARVKAFQAGIGDIFLISLKAGGSGLNLTAADYVIHLDPWWNPAVEDQASDRAHRMGQQRPVTIYRLVTEHTIEEQIVALHGRKRDLADSLLEGGELSAKLDADALLQLLRGENG